MLMAAHASATALCAHLFPPKAARIAIKAHCDTLRPSASAALPTAALVSASRRTMIRSSFVTRVGLGGRLAMDVLYDKETRSSTILIASQRALGHGGGDELMEAMQ